MNPIALQFVALMLELAAKYGIPQILALLETQGRETLDGPSLADIRALRERAKPPGEYLD